MLTWYAQELPSSCVAACVRMALSGLGHISAEAQVRRLLSHTRLGIPLTEAHSRLTKAGAISQYHDDWNLDDLRDVLREGHFPIVGVERHPLGHPPASHAIVLVNVGSVTASALDPLEGPQPCLYGTAAFDLAWRLAGREALVIETTPQMP